MYDNIGSKIKKLAVILTIAESIASFIAGTVMLAGEAIGLALLFMFAGPLFAWASSFLLYGFGELIEKVGSIEEKVEAISNLKVNEVKEEIEKKENVDRLSKEEGKPEDEASSLDEKKYQMAIRKAEEFKSDFFALDYRIRTYEAIIKNMEELSAKNYKDATAKAEEYKQYLSELKASEKKGGCYIATCVYGSYDCPQVWTLRRYRDNCLGASWYGRLFIRMYYAISPTLVKWFGKTSWFQGMWKNYLDKMVTKLQNDGVQDTPYQDKKW